MIPVGLVCNKSKQWEISSSKKDKDIIIRIDEGFFSCWWYKQQSPEVVSTSS